MASGFSNFVKGIGLVGKSSSDSSVLGDIEVLSSDNKLRFHNGSVNDPVVTETAAATLTNKILSGNTAVTLISGSGTLTLNTSGTITAPNGTDTLAGISLSQILTNKTIAAGSNTITGLTNSNLSGSAGISNANLANSSVTINGSAVSLGGSVTVTATATNALTIGTGLSGTSYNGSAPVTIAIDSTVVTLTGSQSLSNKTLTSPVINTPTADTITGIAGGALTVRSASGQNLVLNSQGSSSLLLQVAGTTVGTVSSTGLAMATDAVVSLSRNSQTVTLQGNAAASASYTITLPAAAPGANTGLVFDGSNYVWASAGGWSSSVQTSLTGGGTVTISLTQGQQAIEVQGASAAVTLSTTPFGTSAPNDKTVVRLIGRSSTNTVTIVNNDAAKGVLANGNITLTLGDVVDFMYIQSIDRWVECSTNF